MTHLRHFIAGGCAAYQSSGPCGRRHFCVHRDGECKLSGEAPARCRYLEEAVMPADEIGSATAEYLLTVGHAAPEHETDPGHAPA